MTPAGAGGWYSNPATTRREHYLGVAQHGAATAAAALSQAAAFANAAAAEAAARLLAAVRHAPAVLRALNWAFWSAIGRALAAVVTTRWD